MTPARWRQIEDLYLAAKEREPGERGPFLAEACGDDPELRAKVESMLAQDGPGERVLDRGAAAMLSDFTTTQPISAALSEGAQLGPYRIEGLLGEGGMGKVYKARDTRLGRAVAIKILTKRFEARFEREARAISALNHPHICTLYDVGPGYLVMELIEGETLASRLRKGAISLDLVLRYGAQIASALAAAHSPGILHRDLKPGNIMLGKNGAKVLDFGLAKFTGPAPDSASLSASESILGTVSYMAPEQLEGQECTARSDIFSLGLVLYEMATGKRAFAGDSQAALIANLLRCEPPSLEGLPDRLAHVIERCLARDPDSRWQSAADVKLELEWAAAPAQSTAVTEPAPTSSRRHWLWPSVVAAAGVLAAATFGVLWFRRPAPLDPSAYRYQPFAYTSEQEHGGAWSPDGKSIAFLTDGGRLMVQPSDGGGRTQLAAGLPFTSSIAWSSDGARIYFTTVSDLNVVSLAGGPSERVLRDVSAFDLSRDGKTLAIWRISRSQNGVRGSLWISSPPGSEPREYSPAPFAITGNGQPVVRFSPDGKLLYLSTYSSSGGGTAIWLLPHPSDSGSPRRLFRKSEWFNRVMASWMPDSRRLILAGGAVPLRTSLWLADIREEVLTQLDDGSASLQFPAVSPDGKRLLYSRAEDNTDIVELPVDGSPPRKLMATSLSEDSPSWLPTGGQFVYMTERNGTNELWLRGSQGGWDRPIVTARDFPPITLVGNPAVSPDGARVAYTAILPGKIGLFISPITGGTPNLISTGWAPSWSPDGTSIAYGWVKPNGATVLAVLRLGANQQPFEIPNVPGAFIGPSAWSPSAEWIICGSDTLGLLLVSPDGRRRRTLTPLDTHILAWSKDSQTLYGVSTKNSQMSLVAEDVRTASVRKVADYEPGPIPFAEGFPIGLSLSPDGKSLAIGTVTARRDLWILEGFAK